MTRVTHQSLQLSYVVFSAGLWKKKCIICLVVGSETKTRKNEQQQPKAGTEDESCVW